VGPVKSILPIQKVPHRGNQPGSMGDTCQMTRRVDETPTLQQIMEPMLALQHDNEEVKRQAREVREE